MFHDNNIYITIKREWEDKWEGKWGGGSGRDRRAEYSTTFQNTPEHSRAAAAATTSILLSPLFLVSRFNKQS